jgi:hypothetical protein
MLSGLCWNQTGNETNTRDFNITGDQRYHHRQAPYFENGLWSHPQQALEPIRLKPSQPTLFCRSVESVSGSIPVSHALNDIT